MKDETDKLNDLALRQKVSDLKDRIDLLYTTAIGLNNKINELEDKINILTELDNKLTMLYNALEAKYSVIQRDIEAIHLNVTNHINDVDLAHKI